MTKLTAQKMHDAHKELQEIFIKKNTDYGNSFEESLEKHGLIAAIVRMEDKMSRLNTLSKNKALVKDESIIDTLKDLSNYALMTAVWLEQDEDVKILVDYKCMVYKPQSNLTKPIKHPCTATFGVDDDGRPIAVLNHEHVKL